MFGCLIEQIGKRNCMKIVMATKRNLGFLWRCEKVIQQINPRAVVKLCYVCYQQKVIQAIASQVTQITRSSDPNHQNLKEQELLFSHMKSLAHLPLPYLQTGLDVLKHFAQYQLTQKTAAMLDQIKTALLEEPFPSLQSADFKPVSLWRLCNYADCTIPYQLEFSQDWPLQFKELWVLKERSQSRTITDLCMQVIDRGFQQFTYKFISSEHITARMLQKHRIPKRAFVQGEIVQNDIQLLNLMIRQEKELDPEQLLLLE